MADAHQAPRPAFAVAGTSVGQHLEVVNAMLEDAFLERVAEVGEVLATAYERRGKAIFFGNGGSAADAMHLAGEFLGRFLVDRRPAAALALADNHSAMTAIGNDYGYDQVFSRQLEGLAGPGDVAVALTTSGTSGNVLAGLRSARDLGLKTVALTGANGVPEDVPVDHLIAVPSTVTARIQEAHMLIGHALCEYVEEALLARR